MSNVRRLIAIVATPALLIGIALLILNIYGIVVPMRSPIVGTKALTEDPVTVTPDEFERSIERREGESELEWIDRATRLVDGAIGHWRNDRDEYPELIRVPLEENFVLWTAGVLIPERFGHWEFVSPQKAVDRGIGLCSQMSMVLTSVLREGGVDARITGLDGHVVVAIRLTDGKEIVADPDFGFVMPHSVEELERDRRLVSALYTANVKVRRFDSIIEAWSPEGNRIVGDVKDYHPGLYRVTVLAYTLKWALPIVLVAFGLLGIVQKRNRTRDGT